MPVFNRTATKDAQAYSNDSFDSVGDTLDVGNTSASPDSYTAIEFPDIQVERGSAINSASFVMSMNALPSSDATYHAYLYAAINPTFPTTAAGLRGAALTSVKTDHAIPTSSSTGNRIWSIVAALQEQVNKSTWVKGSSIVVLLKGASTTTRRSIHRSVNNSSGTFAQVLTIDYTPPPLTGTGSATSPSQSASGAGTTSGGSFKGTGGATSPGQAGSGSGVTTRPTATGAGSGSSPGQVVSGTGNQILLDTVASGAASSPDQTASGSGETMVLGFTGEGYAQSPNGTGEGTALTVDPPREPTPLSEMGNALARHMLGLLPPGRLPKERGSAWHLVVALSGVLAETDEQVIKMLFNWSPSRTTRDDLLELIGEGRGLKRNPGEPLEAYRARVIDASAFWRLGGTVPGVKKALETAGYKVAITEHYTTDRTRWAEFSVELSPLRPDLTADQWDDGEGFWGDGTTWDYGLSKTESNRVKQIIAETKAAHSICRSAVYRHGDPVDYWDDGRGSWDEGSNWFGLAPIQII